MTFSMSCFVRFIVKMFSEGEEHKSPTAAPESSMTANVCGSKENNPLDSVVATQTHSNPASPVARESTICTPVPSKLDTPAASKPPSATGSKQVSIVDSKPTIPKTSSRPRSMSNSPREDSKALSPMEGSKQASQTGSKGITLMKGSSSALQEHSKPTTSGNGSGAGSKRETPTQGSRSVSRTSSRSEPTAADTSKHGTSEQNPPASGKVTPQQGRSLHITSIQPKPC